MTPVGTDEQGYAPQDDLSSVIAEKLGTYTDIGLELASQSVAILNETIDQATSELEKNIRQYARQDYQDKGVTRSLAQQLETIRDNYEQLPRRLEEDVLSLPDRTFTITLFGRTEAGKSTLMNVLTHGDGTQIGKGAQRTTRDVRTYSYRGLNVVDVPGIAAAGTGGMEDEELAFEHARRSDLIIFLIMGDAQESEARCLARIKELGKPVMLLLNVHVGITDSGGFDEFDLEDFEYEMEEEFDRRHLDAIRQSLLVYGPSFGQDWSHIPYAYVHLKSAFMARKSSLSKYSERLYQLSHFDDAVQLIEEEAIHRGGYFRLKSYSDAISTPLIEILESLFEQSAENSRQGRLLIRNRQTLEHWTDDYIERSEARIDAFVAGIQDDLRSEAAIFAEDNYNNRKATQEWNKILESRGIETRATELITDLEDECETRLTDLRREIDFDTNLGKYIPKTRRFRAHGVVDAKRVWDWGTGILAGALALGGCFVNQKLIAGSMAVYAIKELGSHVFGFDRMKDNARRKMRDQLYVSIDEQARWLRGEMHRLFNERIVGNQLIHTYKEINAVVDALFRLSSVQHSLAKQINQQLRLLNKATLNEAIAYLGYQGQEEGFGEIARIPGITTVIILKDGTKLSDKLRDELGSLLDEVVRYVSPDDNVEVLLSRVMGRDCGRDRISIERIDDTPRIAHIDGLEDLGVDVRTGIRLGEQITELVVME